MLASFSVVASWKCTFQATRKAESRSDVGSYARVPSHRSRGFKTDFQKMKRRNHELGRGRDTKNPLSKRELLFCILSYYIPYYRIYYIILHRSKRFIMSTAPSLLFVIVGRNEPIFETEIHKRGTMASPVSDAMARQNYFVLHSALDLVDKAAWTSNNMYLKVVDKVSITLVRI